VRQDLLLFAHLGLFLTGTLLYGFLTRELVRHPRVLPGWPIRLLVVCLTVWYGGCLLDALGAILIPHAERLGHLATALDLLRGEAWLLSFPLLTHGLWRLLRDEEGDERMAAPHRAWLAPGYLTLALFLPAAWRAWQERAYLLVDVGRSVYPLVLLHVALSSALSAVLVVRILRRVEDFRLAQFLRWLLAGLAAMAALVGLGALLPPASTAGWSEPLWRLAIESSGLVLGVTFLYFVLRYNLLRLSLSYRTLRHFAALLALIGLATLAGSAAGAGGTPQFRRALAVGLFIALAAAALYTPLQNAALRRWAWLRRLLGKSLTAEELDAWTRRLQSLDLDEAALRDLAAREIGRWLATRARFLEQPLTPVPSPTLSQPPGEGRPRPSGLAFPLSPGGREGVGEGGQGGEGLLWSWFADPAARPFNRLDAPTDELAAVLQRADLQAAFPLRAAGSLSGVLVLEAGPAAGGPQEGDMETVQLVLRQLAGALEVRRLLAERIATERRLAERERLSLLGLVAASLAHELKNPLAAMKALAQTVHEELSAAAPESDQARDLEVIVEQIDRLHGVAREILDFARAPESSDGTAGVDLAALAHRTLYVLGHQAKRRGIDLDPSGVEDVGRVLLPGGTTAAWQTVLFNLLLNAAQHAPAGSTVRVRLAREDGAVVFATENAGPPIPPEVESRLFAPFVTAGKDGGTGLGLALVAQRVRDLGGTITVRNEPDRIAFRVRVEETA
jgi:signal transduction histidine kinase